MREAGASFRGVGRALGRAHDGHKSVQRLLKALPFRVATLVAVAGALGYDVRIELVKRAPK